MGYAQGSGYWALITGAGVFECVLSRARSPSAQRPLYFAAYTWHQPFAETDLPAKIWQGPDAPPASP